MPFDSSGNWKPNIPQARLLSVPDTIKEAGYLGGAGSGKSELLLMMPIVRKWHEVKGFKQLFTRRTFPELKREIVPRSFDIYPKFGGKFNKIDMVWTFESGANIFFGHIENESDVKLYDSMEINLFTPDEITSYTEFIYLYIGFTRVRTSNRSLPAIIRCAGMPGGVGHSWVKKRFIDPYPTGGKIIVGKGGNKRIFIFATLQDNPHIDPGYSQSLDALPEAERQAKKFGSFDAYSGQVFSEYRDVKYPDEPENAIHLVKPFVIPEWWPRIVSIDWGFNAMTSVGFAAISPNNRLYIYRHSVFYGEKIADWASKIKLFIDKENPADIVICHSASQHRGEPHTILEQVEEVLGRSIRLGEKDRIGGKLLIHEFLRWKSVELPAGEVKPYDAQLALWIYRNQGLNAHQSYLKQYQEVTAEENIPKLQLLDDPHVRMIGDAIKACIYEKTGEDGKKKEDVAEFNGDDPYDMLRMLLHAADAFFGVGGKIQERMKRTEDVVNRLAATGDMTSFYRNMRKIESVERIKPVRLIHRGGRRH